MKLKSYLKTFPKDAMTALRENEINLMYGEISKKLYVKASKILMSKI